MLSLSVQVYQVPPFSPSRRSFLHVGRPGAGTALAAAVSDDDGAGGTNSRVQFVADRDGPVTIRVNTLAGGETGRYTVLLETSR